LSVFAIYSLALRWGLINFVFASGLMIWAVARLEKELRSTRRAIRSSGGVARDGLSVQHIPAFLYIVYATVRLLPLAAGQGRPGAWGGFIRLAVAHGAGPAAIAVLSYWERPRRLGKTVRVGSGRKFEAVATLLRVQEEPFELTLAIVGLITSVALAWTCLSGSWLPKPFHSWRSSLFSF
jgi:hypothetical protein